MFCFAPFSNNRPFVATGHMVQKPPYWRAKECDNSPLGNANEDKPHYSYLTECVFFWSLAHSFAIQYGGFCTI